MSTITFTVSFSGGEGSIIFEGPGIDGRFEMTEDGSFSVEQDSGRQNMTVGGNIPNSESGKITVVVSKDGEIISSAERNTFAPQTDEDGNKVFDFSDFIHYEV